MCSEMVMISLHFAFDRVERKQNIPEPFAQNIIQNFVPKIDDGVCGSIAWKILYCDI